MQQSPEIDKLAAALAVVQAGLKPAVKDAVNPHYKSRYADLSAVWDACREALGANGLSIVQVGDVTDQYQAVLHTRLLHVSGQWIGGVYPLAPAAAGPQAMGSALTYARRYCLAALLGIVAEEDDDGNAASAPPARPRPATASYAPGASRPTPQQQPTTAIAGTLEGPFGITRIYSCAPDKRRPGKVVFDDGIEATTFSESDIAMAKQLKNTSVLRGLERVEKNGKVYVNLAAIAPYHEMDAPTPDDEEPLQF